MNKVKTGILFILCIILSYNIASIADEMYKSNPMLTLSLPSPTPTPTPEPTVTPVVTPAPSAKSETKRVTNMIYRGSERVIDLGYHVATAYTDSIADCGKDDGITKSGVKVQPNVTVAVDPRYIKMFSKLRIEDEHGKVIRARAVAHDIGGAIKGKKIDIYFTSTKECIEFGRRKVKVYRYVD